MNWHSLQDFLAMGGYASYVWGSFGAVFGLMMLEVRLLGQHERQAQASVDNHDDEGAA